MYPGVVPCNTRMMCGFVYLPSFDSPNSAEFSLLVGSTIDDDYQTCAALKLNAKVTLKFSSYSCYLSFLTSFRRVYAILNIDACYLALFPSILHLLPSHPLLIKVIHGLFLWYVALHSWALFLCYVELRY